MPLRNVSKLSVFTFLRSYHNCVKTTLCLSELTHVYKAQQLCKFVDQNGAFQSDAICPGIRGRDCVLAASYLPGRWEIYPFVTLADEQEIRPLSENVDFLLEGLLRKEVRTRSAS